MSDWKDILCALPGHCSSFSSSANLKETVFKMVEAGLFAALAIATGAGVSALVVGAISI
jgi:hypothetical protein